MKLGFVTLTGGLLMALASSAGAYYFNVDSNTMALWRFDEGAGDSVYDASGHGNHGKIYGAGWVNSPYGKALSFNGIDNKVIVRNDSSLMGHQKFTIEIIVRPDGLNDDYRALVCKSPSNGCWNDAYSFELHKGNQPRVCVNGNKFSSCDVIKYTSQAKYQVNTWHYVALVYDGDSLFVYSDGNRSQIDLNDPDYLFINNNFPIKNTSYDLYIGNSQDISRNRTLLGSIDEIRISNIARNFNNQTIDSVFFKNDSNTIALWRFDEGAGDSIFDLSGHGNHGKLFNNPTWIKGKYSGALGFDGINDYLEIKHNASQVLMKNISIEAHVYLTENSSKIGAIVDKHGQGGTEDDCYILSLLNDNSVYGMVGDGTSLQTEVSSRGKLALNQWHILQSIYSGDSLSIFIDNQIDTTVAANPIRIQNYSVPIWIGRDHSDSSAFFRGRIDEIKISTVKLMPPTILFPFQESEIIGTDSLSWSTPVYPGQINYQCQFSLDSSFSTILGQESNILKTSVYFYTLNSFNNLPKFTLIYWRVRAVISNDYSGWSTLGSFYKMDHSSITSKYSKPTTPFLKIIPNPINRSTTLQWYIKKASHASIKIYDIHGVLIKNLIYQEIGRGFHSIVWDCSNFQKKKVSSGIYILSFDMPDFKGNTKLFVIN